MFEYLIFRESFKIFYVIIFILIILKVQLQLYNYNSINHYAIKISNNSKNGTENNFGYISNGKWTDAQRRIVWMLLVKARAGLKIEINPVVATAFVILQKYFRNLDKNYEDQMNENEIDSNYDLLTLMIAALFTACKIRNDTFRTMENIYYELSKICINAPSQKIRLIVSPRVNHYMISKLCFDDYKVISQCEIDLLDATGFNIAFDLPFKYYNDILIVLDSLLPRDSMRDIYNTWLIDACLMICSQYYLDLPPDVVAAAAVVDSFENRPTQFNLNTQQQIQFNQPMNDTVSIADGATQYIADWVEGIKQKHGEKLFQLAQHAIMEEKQRTVQPTH